MISRIKRWLFSLQFGIFLLILMAVYVTFGTLLPQNLPDAFYVENYAWNTLVLLLGFNKAYSSWIFRVIMVLFLINLSGCTLKMIPSLQRRFHHNYFPSPTLNAENLWPDHATLATMLPLLKKKGFTVSESPDEPGTYRAVRHRFGVFGPTITHIGIITIILSSFVGNYFAQEGFFNLMPGETASFHEENFSVSLSDFYITHREDGSVEQYYSDLMVLENDIPIKEETIWVNKPLRHNGMMLYQTSFGWASKLQIRETASGDLVQESYMRDEETIFFQPAHLNIQLFGYYPDFQIGMDGMPLTMTQEKRNPHYAVVLYHFGEFVDSFIMNPDQRFTYLDYEISFPDSVMYTGLIFRKDYGYYAVLLGCLFLLAGLMLAFYFYPKYIYIRDGVLHAISRQNSWGFSMWLKRQMSQFNKKEGDIQ